MIDYQAITADEQVGTQIGKLYMKASPVVTDHARIAYADFVLQVERQFRRMLDDVWVEFQDDDPYRDASEMMADVRRNGRLKVYRTTEDQRHPVLSLEENNRFRAVHDYFGHCGANRGFDRHGEEAAWVRHSQMFTGLGRLAMTSETRGQNSAFVWINGGREFPPQKAILLPPWVAELPKGLIP